MRIINLLNITSISLQKLYCCNIYTMASRKQRRQKRQQRRRGTKRGGADEAPAPAAPAPAEEKKEEGFLSGIQNMLTPTEEKQPPATEAPATAEPAAAEPVTEEPAAMPEQKSASDQAPLPEEKPSALASLFGNDEKPAEQPVTSTKKNKGKRRGKYYTKSQLKAYCSRRRRSNRRRSNRRVPAVAKSEPVMYRPPMEPIY